MKKNKIMKKTISLVLVLILILSISNMAYGSESNYNDIRILVNSGYTEGTAMALAPEERFKIAQNIVNDPSKVDIYTISMEIDNLAEIEALFSYSELELESMGADLNKVYKTKKELLKLCDNQSIMAQKINISDIQADMIRRAVEKGIENRESGKGYNKINDINASGSITTSEMSYTQVVDDQSTTQAPKYEVTIAYTWKEVYALAIFDDVIASAWGGGFNTKNINSNANYHDYTNIGDDFGSYYTCRDMTKTETPQTGIEFEFPQSVYRSGDIAPKTKNGYAQFTLYQNQFQNYDTKVVSAYGHQIISVGVSVTISDSPVSVDFSIAYDETDQKTTTLTY